MQTLSSAGLDLLKRFEGLRLKAYLDAAKVPTIGYGTIRYPDGRRVTMGDTCTTEQAEAYLQHDVQRFESAVRRGLTVAVSQTQFDALTCFTYNVGAGAWQKSTLRVRVNANPSDPGIRKQFMRWVYAGGKPVAGLKARRALEADLYFLETT